MDLADRTNLLDELPLAAMLLSVVVAAFLVGAIVGAEAMAAGSPTFPPAVLPGLIWSGEATDKFLSVYRPTVSALWVLAVAVIASTAASTYHHRHREK